MPAPRKPVHLQTGHSKGRKATPRLGLVPVRTESIAIPEPPTGLAKRTQELWRDYWQSKVSSAVDPLADMHRIERWIRQVDEYDKVFRIFKRSRVVPGIKGGTVLNPLASYLATLETQITRCEKELGLTPLARAQLGLTFGEAKLTAVELNRQLNALEQSGESSTDEMWMEGWESG